VLGAAVLSLLARTGPGTSGPGRGEEDITVTATDSGVRVTFGDRRTSFDALVAGDPTVDAGREVTP
jgi:hypothetical protein